MFKKIVLILLIVFSSSNISSNEISKYLLMRGYTALLPSNGVVENSTSGFKDGFKIFALGCIAYVVFCSSIYYLCIRKKHENDKIINPGLVFECDGA